LGYARQVRNAPVSYGEGGQGRGSLFDQASSRPVIFGGLPPDALQIFDRKTRVKGKETKMGESLITLALWLAKVHVIIAVVVVIPH
jgi:hypothetical protein